MNILLRNWKIQFKISYGFITKISLYRISSETMNLWLHIFSIICNIIDN